jgi:hypothetical protein
LKRLDLDRFYSDIQGLVDRQLFVFVNVDDFPDAYLIRFLWSVMVVDGSGIHFRTLNPRLVLRLDGQIAIFPLPVIKDGLALSFFVGQRVY